MLKASRRLPVKLAIAAVVLFWVPPRVRAGGRDVAALSQWAQESGIRMHPHLQWKNHGEEDWGLELSHPVPRGTVLLTVPRSMVLDSSVIKKELAKENPTQVETCVQALGPFQVHEDNFWIVLQLFKCRWNKRTTNGNWAPWLAAMPQTFPEFSKAEQECLPYYAKYAAEYQEKKFQAFCQAAAALGELDDPENAPEMAAFKWAFQAVGSRFWKTAAAQESRSELVPLGDMFNHRDPPNVQMVPHKEDQVTFVYLGGAGDDESASKDLFITYGHPSNPHRFLVVFGFVPTDMRHLWSHAIYSDSNPYSNDVTNMVFETSDGTISQHVWDAVMFELLQPGVSHEQFLERKDQLSPKYKWYAADLLDDHVTKQLDELADLRQKISDTEGENMALIRQHNEFLSTVFGKVQANLKQIKQDLGAEVQ